VDNLASNEPDPCPTNLIPDRVTSDDAFRHREIASAIAKMMRSESGGCAIALTGAWGSGKSTVVGLLERELKDGDNQFQSFVFDSWAHQGDPLRRTFLETLINWCSGPARGWTKRKDHWESVVKQLASRLEKSKTTSSPNLKLLGALGAISLLLAPLALQIYLKTQYQDPNIWWDRTGFFFGALPALLAIGAVVFWLWTEGSQPKKDRKALPSLAFTEAEKTVESETSKTPDPTSVEFERIYRDLMNEVLEKKERRLLIVVDNLDRIDQQDARSIWATLRVFFDFPDAAPTEWHTRVWVLVPFDDDAINTLWETSADDAPANGKSMSRHFLEKTFQATFRVPPIILSNRNEFLTALLQAAFPKHSAQEFHTISRLYDRLGTQPGELPTPRNLKIFVNQIGVLHRQWQDRIPLPEQAAFVLQMGLAQITTSILTTGGGGASPLLPSLPNTICDLVSSEWPRNLAAMYFGVDPKDAYQVLLSDPIFTALRKGDGKALSSLSDNPGFAEVAELVIENICGVNLEADPDTLAHTATAFSALSEDWAGYAPCKIHLWRAALSISKWKPLTSGVATGIVKLIGFTPEKNDLRPIIRSLRDSLEIGPNVRPSPPEQLQALALVLPTLEKRDQQALREEFRLPGSPNSYLEWINYSRTMSALNPVFEYLRPAAPEAEVVESLALQIGRAELNKDSAAALQDLTYVDVDWDWTPVIDALKGRLAGPHAAIPADFGPVVETLFDLGCNLDDAEKVLLSASSEDGYFQHFQSLLRANQYDPAAMLLLVVLSNGRPLQPPPPRPPQPFPQRLTPSQEGRQAVFNCCQNPDTIPGLIAAATKRCLDWLPPGQWRELSQQKQDRQTIVRIMLSRSLKDTNGREIETADLVDHSDFWQSVMGAVWFAKVADERAQGGDLAQVLIRHAFEPEQQHLYSLCLANTTDPDYPRFLMQSLKQLSEDPWKAAMEEETELITMALMLKEQGLELGQEYLDALAAHVDEKLGTTTEPGPLAQRWTEVVEMLDTEHLDVFHQRLLSKFNNAQGSVHGLLPYYGKIISTLLRDPKQSIERIISIIAAHDPAEVNWLAETLASWSARGKQANSLRKDWAERAEKSMQGQIPPTEKTALANLIAVLKPRADI